MAKRQRTEEAAEAPEAEGSREHDEHRGLAARILDLRNLVESERLARIKDQGELKQRMALLDQQLTALEKRVDRECESIQKMQRDLEETLRQSSDQLRKAGEFVRKIDDGMKALEELRETQTDPHEVVKPVQRALALLRGDVEALGRTIDIRFEQLPKARSQPWEERGDDSPIEKQARLLADLHQRVKKLEA
jgi:DNA repair exonuclease SbcCD ATPase subunit